MYGSEPTIHLVILVIAFELTGVASSKLFFRWFAASDRMAGTVLRDLATKFAVI